MVHTDTKHFQFRLRPVTHNIHPQARCRCGTATLGGAAREPGRPSPGTGTGETLPAGSRPAERAEPEPHPHLTCAAAVPRGPGRNQADLAPAAAASALSPAQIGRRLLRPGRQPRGRWPSASLPRPCAAPASRSLSRRSSPGLAPASGSALRRPGPMAPQRRAATKAPEGNGAAERRNRSR